MYKRGRNLIFLRNIQVERESIDLVDKTLAVCNEEMLSISGVLSLFYMNLISEWFQIEPHMLYTLPFAPKHPQ